MNPTANLTGEFANTNGLEDRIRKCSGGIPLARGLDANTSRVPPRYNTAVASASYDSCDTELPHVYISS